jgi:hypothetical protein
MLHTGEIARFIGKRTWPVNPKAAANPLKKI